MLSRQGFMLLALAVWCQILGPVTAQDAAQDTVRNAAPLDDEAKKIQIMESEEWRQTRYAFQQWLSVQDLYDPQQVEKMKADIENEIASMSAAELQDFLAATKDKLAVLMSDEAKQAHSWLGNYLSVLAVRKAEEVKKELPDVANMTAAQLEQALQDFQRKRQGDKRKQQFFDSSRQRTANAYLAETKRQKQVFESAWQRGLSASASQATSRAQRPLLADRISIHGLIKRGVHPSPAVVPTMACVGKRVR